MILKTDYTEDTEDEERLPEGFSRIAYDSDRQVYLYRDDKTKELWEGEPGLRFGHLHRVIDAPESPLFTSDLLPSTVEDPSTELKDTWTAEEPETKRKGTIRGVGTRVKSAWRHISPRTHSESLSPEQDSKGPKPSAMHSLSSPKSNLVDAKDASLPEKKDSLEQGELVDQKG